MIKFFLAISLILIGTWNGVAGLFSTGNFDTRVEQMYTQRLAERPIQPIYSIDGNRDMFVTATGTVTWLASKAKQGLTDACGPYAMNKPFTVTMNSMDLHVLSIPLKDDDYVHVEFYDLDNSCGVRGTLNREQAHHMFYGY